MFKHTFHISALNCFAWVFKFCPEQNLSLFQTVQIYTDFFFIVVFSPSHTHWLELNGNCVFLRKEKKNYEKHDEYFLFHDINLIFFLIFVVAVFVLFFPKFQWRFVNFSRQSACVALLAVARFFVALLYCCRVSVKMRMCNGNNSPIGPIQGFALCWSCMNLTVILLFLFK